MLSTWTFFISQTWMRGLTSIISSYFDVRTTNKEDLDVIWKKLNNHVWRRWDPCMLLNVWMFQNEEAGFFEHGVGISTYAHFDSQEWWVTIEFGGCPILGETHVTWWQMLQQCPSERLSRDLWHVWRSVVFSRKTCTEPKLGWEIQDPKMEVLYHIRPYFCGDIPLHGPYIRLTYGRYLQFRFLKWPLTKGTWKLVYQHSCNPLLLSWILGLAARIRSCLKSDFIQALGQLGQSSWLKAFWQTYPRVTIATLVYT